MNSFVENDCDWTGLPLDIEKELVDFVMAEALNEQQQEDDLPTSLPKEFLPGNWDVVSTPIRGFTLVLHTFSHLLLFDTRFVVEARQLWITLATGGTAYSYVFF